MNDWIWLLLFGIFIAAGSILLYRREKRLFESAVPATATVIRYEEYRSTGRSRTMYSAVVAYTLADGAPMEAKEPGGSTRLKYDIGQILDIEYSPQRPHLFIVRGDNSRTVGFALVLLFGLALIFLGVALFLRGRA